MVSTPPTLLTAADHTVVSQAIASAEARSDAEISTIVAARSHDYRDWALRWSLVVPIAWLAITALWPAYLERGLTLIFADWTTAPGIGATLALVLACQLLLFGITRLLLQLWPVRLALTPSPVKRWRVRRSAVQAFRIGTEARTRAATGVLVYVSLAEHRAEIIADAAIHAKVSPDVWAEPLAALLTEVRAGAIGDGIAEAVTLIGDIVAEHFPRRDDDSNELPDRLIEL